MIFITGQNASVPQSERGTRTNTHTLSHTHTHTRTHLWGPPKEWSHSKRLTSEKRRFFISKMICSINLNLYMCLSVRREREGEGEREKESVFESSSVSWFGVSGPFVQKKNSFKIKYFFVTISYPVLWNYTWEEISKFRFIFILSNTFLWTISP